MISSKQPNHDKLAMVHPLKEWAILGTNCNHINSLADILIKELSKNLKFTYVDKSHVSDKDVPSKGDSKIPETKIVYHNGRTISKWSIDRTVNSNEINKHFPESDMILYNGNHFESHAQILVIDSAKEESIKKRLQQLNNVQLVLIKNGTPIFDFIKTSVPSIESVPTLDFNDHSGIVIFFLDQINSSKPKLNGLVLAGGKSLRMGQDKGSIQFFGKPQREYMADLLKDHCDEVYISEKKVRADSRSNYPALIDSFLDLGPYGAILSAFRSDPSKAWLVVASDLPLFNNDAIIKLISERDISKIATAYASPVNGNPEPLAAIWEPKSYPVLLEALSKGLNCPRKLLMNNDIKLIKANDPDTLKNINTPEDLNSVLQIIKSKETAEHEC